MKLTLKKGMPTHLREGAAISISALAAVIFFMQSAPLTKAPSDQGAALNAVEAWLRQVSGYPVDLVRFGLNGALLTAGAVILGLAMSLWIQRLKPAGEPWMGHLIGAWWCATPAFSMLAEQSAVDGSWLVLLGALAALGLATTQRWVGIATGLVCALGPSLFPSPAPWATLLAAQGLLLWALGRRPAWEHLAGLALGILWLLVRGTWNTLSPELLLQTRSLQLIPGVLTCLGLGIVIAFWGAVLDRPKLASWPAFVLAVVGFLFTLSQTLDWTVPTAVWVLPLAALWTTRALYEFARRVPKLEGPAYLLAGLGLVLVMGLESRTQSVFDERSIYRWVFLVALLFLKPPKGAKR